jgi:type IV fimbrial biogenesis protein FimT
MHSRLHSQLRNHLRGQLRSQLRAHPGTRPRGFTLIEVLVVMTVIAIVASIAVPSFSSFVADQRARSAASDLMTAILSARSEAIKRNSNVTITALTAGGATTWGAGWLVTAADGTQLARKDIDAGRLDSTTLPAGTTSITFNGAGRMTLAGTLGIELRGASGSDGVSPRCMTIDLGGRPQLNRGGCAL